MVADVIILTIAAAFILYKYATRNFDYWKQKGVPYVKPFPFFGNIFTVFAQRMAMGNFFAKHHSKFETPYFGIYVMNKPYLVIRSPDLIKHILVKDFDHFHDRTMVCDEKLDSLSSKFLFLARHPEWKFMRSKINPAFTSGKIKNMVPLINAVGEDMKTYLNKKGKTFSIEGKELCAKFGINAVATCAFGIDANCFQNENAQFGVIGKNVFGFQWKTALRQMCYFLAPGLVKLLRMPFVDYSVADFLREVIWSTVEEREKTMQKRNDVIDIVIQIRNKSTPNDIIKFDGDTVVAQAGQFYTAGFETVSYTMSYTLYELCFQPDIQTKVRSEVKTIIAQYGGLTYEALQDMKYLHMVVCETLRKYPILPFLDRMCMKDYRIPDSDVVVEKGTPVYVSILGLHHDPEYFPDPERFDPERFSKENKTKPPSYSYIPFGEGPRNCIGERFGLLVLKLGLAHILSEFEVERSADTPVPIKFHTKGFLLGSTVGWPMIFRKTYLEAA